MRSDLAPDLADPLGAGNRVLKDRVLCPTSVIRIGNKLSTDRLQRALTLTCMVFKQKTNNLFPWLQLLFVPFTVPFPGLWLNKGILNPATHSILRVERRRKGIKARMMRPFVARVIRNRSSGMAMGDKATFNPFVTDVTIDKGIEDQISRLNRFLNSKKLPAPLDCRS